jgi:arylsulfatase A-like enzyme
MVYKDKFGPDVFNEFVLNFITENKENPFFIYYPMVLPHSPFVNTPLELGVKDKYSKHKAMVKYIDHLTGKLIDHLTNLGLRENTIVVWTSDNGTSTKINNTRHGKLVKGGKMQTTENGVNTPFIVSCPSLIPQGKTTDALVDFTDMHQTFADFAGVTPDQSYVYDGLSAKEVFLNTTKGTRTWVMAMGSEPGVFTHKGIENKFYFRDRVLRNERYKIFIDSNREVVKLIDLKNDPEEKLNLINNPEYKSILQDLSEKIDVFPEYDQDPKYTVRKPNPWDRKATRPSKVHKKGYPNTAKSNRSQK